MIELAGVTEVTEHQRPSKTAGSHTLKSPLESLASLEAFLVPP